jgi:hypothetical protein
MKKVLDLDSEIVLIQETWLEKSQEIVSVHNSQNSPYDFRRMDRNSKKNKTGGGTLLLFKQGIQVIKEVRLNKDSGLYQMIINTTKGTKTIWLANVYLNRGTMSQIQKIFRCIEKIIPPEYLSNTFHFLAVFLSNI